MKLAKRIVALAIVLCTVAAMMIPGVSAAETKDLAVDFKTLFTAGGWTGSMDNLIINGYDPANEKAHAVEAGLYGKYNDLGVRFYRGANNQYLFSGYKLAVQGGYGTLHVASYLGKTAYAPLEFKAPATGNYTLTIDFSKSEDDPNLVTGAYIVPAASSGRYTTANLPKTGSATVSYTGMTDFRDVKATSKTSDTTVSLEAGKDYVIVFFVTCPASSPKSSTSLYQTFTGFKLNPAGASTGGSTGGSQSPNTGDAGMQMWFALMAVSCLGLAAMVVCKKKEA